MNSTTSTITVTFDDGTITLEEIMQEIKKRKFQVSEQVDVTTPEGKPSEKTDPVAPPPAG
ncbi:MAG TPA: hypothetical protein PLA74_04475 [Syntrophales bacterium]|nr:hypothetical protein [Syntrophales bacterium]HPQ43663.1 hypothetical protein [Syntrophales bacterium]